MLLFSSIGTVSNMLGRAAAALTPLVVIQHFGGGALELGWMQSAMGIGAVRGGVILGFWGGYRRRVVTAMFTLAVDGNELYPSAVKRFRQQWSLDLIPPDIIRAARAAYLGLITQIDFNMGRVFAALQDLDLFRDTLILYASDHGEILGHHHCGAKTYFYEGSAHVPFVLRLPQSWENRGHGTVCDKPVTLADIMPTLVGAAGGIVPVDADGVDLLALSQNQKASPPSYVVATGSFEPGQLPSYLAVTDGRWKYIWYPEGSTAQLFDLETDPHEPTNLAGLPYRKLRPGCTALRTGGHKHPFG